ncbi:MAG: hypothetical protein WC900_00590 [Oscillospiraceae bacterium]|jgi:hypothetical protein
MYESSQTLDDIFRIASANTGVDYQQIKNRFNDDFNKDNIVCDNYSGIWIFWGKGKG